MGSSSGSYVRGVAAVHRKYQVALKRAKSRQQILNAYWKHKKECESLLARYLREQRNEIKQRQVPGGTIPPRKR